MDPVESPVAPQADDLGYQPDLPETPLPQDIDLGGPTKKPKPVVPPVPQNPGAQQASHVASQRDPDRWSKVLTLANQLHIPDTGFVDRNYDMLIGADSRAKQQQQISGVSPTLANWLSDPDNATLAKDELPSLVKVDAGVKSLTPEPSTGFVPAMMHAGITGFNDVEASAWQLGAVYGLVPPEVAAQHAAKSNKIAANLRDIEPDFATEFNTAMARHRGDINRASQDFINSQETWSHTVIESALLGLKTGAVTIGQALSMVGAAAARPRGLTYATVEGLGQMLPMVIASKIGAEVGALTGAGMGSFIPALGTAVGAGVGGTIGMVGGTFAGVAPINIGQEIQQQLQNRKIDITDPDALLRAYQDPKLMASVRSYAEKKGITNAAVMALVSGLAGRLGEASQESGAVTKIAAKAGDVGIQAGGVAAGQLAGQEAVGEKPDIGAATQTGIQMLAYEIGQTAIGTSLRKLHSEDPVVAAQEVHGKVTDALTAQNAAQTLTEVGNSVKEAKVTSSVPERIKQLVETATGGRDGATVFFNQDEWNKYWQGQNISPAKAAADVMGDEGKAYYEAQSNDSPIAIPLGDYVAKVAPTDHWDGLLQSARMTPDGMTLKEANTYLESLPATMKELADEVGKEGESTEKQKSTKAIRDNIQQQLETAGVPKSEAKIQAKLYEARARTRADILGVDPQELVKQNPITINREEATETLTPEDWTSMNQGQMTEEEKAFLNTPEGQNALAARLLATPEDRASFRRLWEGEVDKKAAQNDADIAAEHKAVTIIDRVESAKPLTLQQEELFPKNQEGLGWPLPAGMHSKAEELITNKMANRASIDDVRGILKDIKSEERKWLGLDKWLNDNAGKTVTKQDVYSFLRASRLHIVERTRDNEVDQDRIDEYVREAIRDTARDRADTQWNYTRLTSEAASERFGGHRGTGWYAIPDEETMPVHRNMEGSFEGPFESHRAARQRVMDLEFEGIMENPDEYEGYDIDAQRAAEENPQTGYESYTLPGGENYREVLFTLPDMYNEINEQSPYESPHFDDVPNIFAHTRLKDRNVMSPDKTNDSMLFMEEVQSDWHQAGREHGYKELDTLPRYDELSSALGKAQEEYEKFKRSMLDKYFIEGINNSQYPVTSYSLLLDNRLYGKGMTIEELDEDQRLFDAFSKAEDNLAEWRQDQRHSVPDAPFRATWHEFVLKRMIREAAQNGYQWLGWTTGDQQNDRYNLTKVVTRIAYTEGVGGADNRGTLTAHNQTGRQVLHEYVEPEKLQDYIGKELAVKLMSQEPAYYGDDEEADVKSRVLEGHDIEVGGEGMRGFYDQIIPRFLNNFTKKYGGKVVDVPLLDAAKNFIVVQGSYTVQGTNYWYIQGNGNEYESDVFNKTYKTKAEADEALKGFQLVVHGLKLTDELKAAAMMDQFSLFQMQGEPKSKAVKTHPLPPPTKDIVGKPSIGKDHVDLYHVTYAENLSDILKSGELHNDRLPGGPTANTQGWASPVRGVYGWATLERATFEIDRMAEQGNVPREDMVIVHIRVPKTAKLKPDEGGGTWEDSYLNSGAAAVEGGVPTSDIQAIYKATNTPEPRGQVLFNPDGSINIKLFAKADRSTFLHETGHVWLEEMRADIASLQGKDNLTTEQQQLIKDGQTVLDYLGVDKWSDIDRMHHEMWARAAEQYFMEGKAPTTPLRSAFYRFKNWLIDLYGTVKALHTDLTPQVREVMDRLLGSREEIQQAESKQDIRPLIEDPAAVGMNEQDAADYALAVHDAHEAAVDELSSKMAQQVQHEQSAEWKQWRDQMLPQVMSEVNDYPVYKLLENLKNPDSGIKLHRQSIVDTFGQEYASKLPRGILDDEGMNPSIVADLFGFKGTRDMVTELMNAGDKNKLINFLTDQRMQQEHGTRPTVDEIKDAAVEAVRGGDKRIQLIHKELQILASGNLAKLKGLVRQITKTVPPTDMVRQQAETIVNSKAVRDIRPDLFEKAANKAGNEARDLLLSGKIDEAFQAKLREMLATQIYKTSADAKKQIAQAQQEFKSMFKGTDKKIAGRRDLDLVKATRAVLATFGIGSTDKPAEEYLKPLAQSDPDTYHVVKNMIDDASQNVKHYKDLSYQDFSAMRELVNSLWQLSLRTRQMDVQGKKIAMETAVKELNDQLALFNDPKVLAGYKKAVGTMDRIKMGLLGFKARMTRVESWVKVVDNGKFGGPARRYIHSPVSDGATAHDLAKMEEMAALAEITKPLHGTMEAGEIDAPELPVTDTDGNPAGNYTFSDKATGLLGALLHTGNGFEPGSNGYKLLVGRGWGKVGDDGKVDTSNWDKFIQRMWKEEKLTKADYDYVQSVWNQFERLKPDAWKTHKERYGFYPTERTKVKFTTPWGDYDGGYFPAKVDPFMVGGAQERAEREQLAGNNASSYMFPSVGRGFTKARSDLYARPLIMDASLVPVHLDAILRFTHLAIPVADVGRLMLNKEFRTKLDNIDPAVGSDLLRPFLDRAATQRIDLPMKGVAGQAMDRLADYVRTTSAMQIMAFNSIVTLEMGTHFAGVLAVPEVKAGKLLSAFWTMLHQPRQMGKDIAERSDFMKTRNSAGLDVAREEINKVMLDPNMMQRLNTFVSANATALMHGFQWVMDHATWQAVYDHMLENPETSDDEAVKHADFVVRDVLGSYRPQDRAAIEAGNVFKRMVLMFYGFFNTRQNYLQSEAILAKRMGLRKGAGRMMVLVPLAFMLPAIAGKGVKVAMSNKPYREPDEDEGHLLARFFGDAMEEMAVRMTPFAGPLIDAAGRAFNKQSHLSDEPISSPAIRIVEDAVHAPGEVYKAIHDNMYKDKTMTDFFTLIGMATRFPMRPISKLVNLIHRGRTQ